MMLTSYNKSNSGYKGVYKIKKYKNPTKPFEASLNVRKKTGEVIKFFIGCFETAELAHIARIKYIDSLK